MRDAAGLEPCAGHTGSDQHANAVGIGGGCGELCRGGFDAGLQATEQIKLPGQFGTSIEA